MFLQKFISMIFTNKWDNTEDSSQVSPKYPSLSQDVYITLALNQKNIQRSETFLTTIQNSYTPNFEETFPLTTDTSALAIEDVLSQRQVKKIQAVNVPDGKEYYYEII